MDALDYILEKFSARRDMPSPIGLCLSRADQQLKLKLAAFLKDQPLQATVTGNVSPG